MASNCTLLTEQCGALLFKAEWSDCRFVVGSESNKRNFAAHKLILAMMSSVFERMFFGDFSEKSDTEIIIIDIEPDTFELMLKYMFGVAVNIPLSNKVYKLIYGAKKYMLNGLSENCCDSILKNLNAANACEAYEFGKFFDEVKLIEKSLSIIQHDISGVLRDPSFFAIEFTTLLDILDLGWMNIPECDLFQRLIDYAWENHMFTGVHTTGKNNLEQSPCPLDTKQNVSLKDLPVPTSEPNGETADRLFDSALLRRAVKKIRFLTFTPQEFAKHATSELLTTHEALAIFIKMSGSDCKIPETISQCTTKRM